MLSNDQIEAKVVAIAARLSSSETQKPGESNLEFMKRMEQDRLVIASEALTLLSNFLCNINDLAYQANEEAANRLRNG